jgi:Domain of unknown function (DUF4265)
MQSRQIGQATVNERVKLWLTYTNSHGEDETETMWAIERNDCYELDNIPFYVMELALGDVVAAQPDASGLLRYSGLVRPSGHSTIQLWFSNESDVKPIREELRKMGCASEVSDRPRLVAVDIPPNVPYEKVKAFLDEGEHAERFEYQEACLGFL